MNKKKKKRNIRGYIGTLFGVGIVICHFWIQLSLEDLEGALLSTWFVAQLVGFMIAVSWLEGWGG